MIFYRVTGHVYILGDGALDGAYVVAISSDEGEDEWIVTDRTDSTVL
jgi:hypothetical protein